MAITGDTKIITVYDGPQRLDELMDYQSTLIYCWNPETKLCEVKIMHSIMQIANDEGIFFVEFDSGLVVKCTLDHEFYTFRGDKVGVGGLSIGQSIRAFSLSDHRGHLRVHGWVNNKVRHQYVARMVWESFNGEIPEGLVLHHKDMNKQNNRIENFQLLTNSEHNSIHYDERRARGFGRWRNHKVTDISVAYEGFNLYTFQVNDFNNFVIADETPVAGLYSGIISAV